MFCPDARSIQILSDTPQPCENRLGTLHMPWPGEGEGDFEVETVLRDKDVKEEKREGE